MGPQEERVDANSVINVQRERIDALTWENTLLEAKLRDARAQLSEIVEGQKSD